jgi:hypothetical protein
LAFNEFGHKEDPNKIKLMMMISKMKRRKRRKMMACFCNTPESPIQMEDVSIIPAVLLALAD